MTLTRWQRPDFWSMAPFRRVTNLQNEVDSLFNLAFGRLGHFNGQGALEGWIPAVDIYEDKNTLLVNVELPGLKKENIEISLHDGSLIISGERKHEKKQEATDVYRSERYVGRFHRSVSLPYPVQADKINATYNEGVLTVTLPKAEEAKPKQIPISVK